MKSNRKFAFYENLSTKEIIVRIDNNFYKLGFESAFKYLNKEQKQLLEKLFDYAKNFNSGYVDSIVWFSYLATSKIELPPMKEQYQYINFDKLKDIDMSVQKSGRNINTNLTKKDFIDNNIYQIKTKPLFPISNGIDLLKENMSSDNFCMILQKTIYYNTDIDFLLALLHCIFTTNKRYYLKICNRCEEYYITNKTDNCYCNRLYDYNNKHISCSDISKTLKKTYEYVELNKKHKSFLQTLNKNKHISSNYIEEYKKEHKEKVREYIRTMNIVPLKDFINTYEELHPYN